LVNMPRPKPVQTGRRAARSRPPRTASPGPPETPKQRILRAAAHLFRTQGYDRTTVRELADAVGILSGSLFHHFPSKEAILEAVMADVIALNTTRLERSLRAACSPLERLRALVHSELVSIHGETGEAMSLLFLEWRSLRADAQQRLLAMRDRYEANWLDALRAVGHAEPFVLRRLLTGAIAHTATWYRPEGPMDLDSLTDCVTALASRRVPEPPATTTAAPGTPCPASRCTTTRRPR
jgi:TetR/AcrR family transcriptional regulator, cholesterol catabolism regulator